MITLELVPDKAQHNLPLRIETVEAAAPWAQHEVVVDVAGGQHLAGAHQTLSPAHAVQFFQGKSDFCAIISSQHLNYLLLPGARFESTDTLVEMAPSAQPVPPSPAPIATHNPSSPPQTVTSQAMILGAGIASRFEPFSGDTTGYSKPGTPLLGDDSVIVAIAKHLKTHGIRRLLVNTFYRPEQIKQQLNAIDGLDITYTDETAPSGTAGGLAKAIEQQLVNPDEPMLIIQGDAVTNADLSFLLNTHHQQHAALTIGGQIVGDEDVHRFGMIDTDRCTDDGQSGRIVGFREKPTLVQAGPTRFANTGFYIFDPILFESFLSGYHQKIANNPSALYDYACDVFPTVLTRVQAGELTHPQTGKAYTFWAQALSGYWCDIGNPTQYMTTLADIDAGHLCDKTPEFLALWQRFYNKAVVTWPGSHAFDHELKQVTLTGPCVVTPIPKTQS